MRILAVIDALDFRNYPRRATFEAIARRSGELDVVCYTHIRNFFRTDLASDCIRFHRRFRIVPLSWARRWKWAAQLHGAVSRVVWRSFLKQYDVIVVATPFFADVLPVCEQRLVFILSDPFHVRSPMYRKGEEEALLTRADLIFTVSRRLRDHYLPSYFQHTRENVHLWPNTVDLRVWDYRKRGTTESTGKTVGFAGNIYEANDLALLQYAVERLTDLSFELVGHNNLRDERQKRRLNQILGMPNVSYKGHVDYEELPGIVSGWDACLMLDDRSELGTYMHPNKAYQYLAMGKPVVARRNNEEFDALKDVIYLSEDEKAYVAHIKEAVAQSRNVNEIEKRLAAAKANSSEVRAEQFLQIVSQLEFGDPKGC